MFDKEVEKVYQPGYLTRLMFAVACVSRQTFPESLAYNQATGLFEVATGAAEFISRRISSALHISRSQLANDDPAALARTPPVNNDYAVSVSREQFLPVTCLSVTF